MWVQLRSHYYYYHYYYWNHSELLVSQLFQYHIKMPITSNTQHLLFLSFFRFSFSLFAPSEEMTCTVVLSTLYTGKVYNPNWLGEKQDYINNLSFSLCRRNNRISFSLYLLTVHILSARCLSSVWCSFFTLIPPLSLSVQPPIFFSIALFLPALLFALYATGRFRPLQ